MKKIGKMAEIAWLIGTFLCAFGVALCTKASFGLSMMAAPPYIIHLRLVEFFPWYSQGTSSYIFEGSMLVVMCLLICKFRPKYLLSFLSSMLFGYALDFWNFLLGGNGAFATLAGRGFSFIGGMLCISIAVAFMFRTYLPAQTPELLVMEVAKHFKTDTTKIKLILDMTCLALSFSLSLLLTGKLTGIHVGTVILAFGNAPLIKLWGKVIEKFFTFDPMFPKLKKFFD